MSISTHVLDTARGAPAAGVPVSLDRREPHGVWIRLQHTTTNADGRVPEMVPDGVALHDGTYRLTFSVDAYDPQAFHPEVAVVFRVTDTTDHYHVPLLLSPYQYTTYRGS